MGHSVTKGNPKPAESTAVLHYNCIRHPSRILLYPVYERAQPVLGNSSSVSDRRQAQCSRVSIFAPLDTLLADSSSLLLARYQVTNDEPIALRVVVMDEAGLVCSNFSSVPLTFQTDQGSAVKLASKDATAKLTLGDFLGNVVVTAKAEPSARSQVEFNVVNPLKVTRTALSLFNDPSELLDLTVSGGSGIYDVAPSNPNQDIVSLEADASGGGLFNFAPRRPGVISVVVRDLCMVGKPPISIKVHVAGLRALQASHTKSFVAVGDSTAVHVRGLNNFDQALSSMQMRKYLRIEPRHDEHISMWPTDQGSSEWTVKCLTVGSGAVYFVGTTPTGETVESASVSVQCFPPLRLFP